MAEHSCGDGKVKPGVTKGGILLANPEEPEISPRIQLLRT
jgi:hypothetical protein